MASKVNGMVEKLNINSTNHAIASTAYGYCETAANTQIKQVDMTGFKLYEGVTVHIKFANANTVANPKLKFNNEADSDAKVIIFSAAAHNDVDGCIGWHSNEILTLTYDGTSWLTTNSAYATIAGSLLAQNVKPTISKTYTSTDFYAKTANDAATSTYFFMSVRPKVWNEPWSVRFKVHTFCPAYTDRQSYTYSLISGRRDACVYHNWNEQINNPHQYIGVMILKAAGYNNGYGHAIGINIRGANNYTNSAYYRTFEIDYYDCDNCTVTILDTPVLRANWSGYNTTNYNGISEYDALNRGLRESGDDNDNGRFYSHNSYSHSTSTLRIPPYSIFGFNRLGQFQGISLYEAGYSSNTTGINTARVYNTGGFDYTRGLWYTNSGTNFAADVDINISPAIVFYAADLRQTDNCIASSTANELGMIVRKPVYLRGTINDDGLFYLAPLSVTYNNATYKRAWTQDIPNSADGYVYWFVGYPYYNVNYAASLYQINLNDSNPLYWYHDGKFQEYVPHAVNATTATNATNDVDGNAIKTTYLKRSGGQMTGPLTWKDSTALPEASSLSYFLGIDAFASGGTTKWISAANARTSIGAAASSHNHSGVYVPNTTGANDVNTLVNTGIYNITSGSLTNGPTGYGYGQLLVMSYRKHTGNTTTDWATQLYAHLGSGNNGNTLYYRTSNTNTWQTWQMVAHADAGTALGGAKKPIYITAQGVITEGDAIGASAYHDDTYFSLSGHNHNSIYYKLDGSNTGTKLSISTQSAAYTNGICFMNDTTKKGSVGTDNNGVLGLYSATKVVLRPQLDASTKGVEITTSAMYPTASITLGTSTAANKWSTVYATTYDGAILKLHQGSAADPSTTSNARIEFDYSSGQPVYIAYTPNDSYRAPAGLKIMGNGTTTSGGSSPAWLEVEGSIYADGGSSNKGYRVPTTGNGTGSIGGTTTPVYVEAGVIKALSYTIAKSVPSDAKFTDTTYDAGAGLQLSTTTFSIKDNAVRRNKLMMTDTMNYAELNDYSATDWGFTADTTTDGHWYTMNTLARDKYVSDYYQCNGGETFNIQFEISTTVKGNSSSGGTDSVYKGTAVGIYTWNEANTSQGIVYSDRTTATSEGTATVVNSNVTISANARKFRVFIQTEGWGNFSGTLKIRKLKVIRVSAPKWYGDLSGNAATASGVKDYNNNSTITFGYSTSGMTSTSWLGSWDNYKLRAISPANALKSAVGTTQIGGTTTPIYWTGSAFSAGTALKNLAYIDKPSSNQTTTYLRGDGSWVSLSDMGLSNALHFIGITSTELSDGSTTATLTAKSTNSLSKTTGFVDGDVVMDGDQLREYVWVGTAWRLLGITTSAAYSQTATGNSWITSITQGTDGKITATIGTLDTSGEWSGNAGTATALQNARTLWGQSFDGSANITGSLIDVGNQIKLLSGNSEFQFLTSSGGAANGKFGKLGLNTTYANIDFTNYVLDVNGKTRIGALDGGQHVINGNVQLNAQSGSFNEGLRINRSTTGYANIYLGGTRSSASGNQAGGWWIGTLSTPADATSNGNTITNTVFTISNNNTADTLSIKGTRGATIGTNSGWAIRPRLAIGATYDTNYTLKVAGMSWLQGPLRIGNADTAGTETGQNGYATANSGSTNYIAFYGTYNDNPGNFNHTYIGESIYGPKDTANEKSELLLFKGNDIGSAASGPDRIRLFANEIDIQVYTSTLYGTWDTIRATTGTQVANFKNGQVTITGNLVPEATDTRTLGTSSLKWDNVYATTFTGNLTGDVTGNVSGSSGSCTGNAATATNAANTQSKYGAKSFIVEGDKDTYYPVIISGYTSHGAWTLLNISRDYAEQAPDTWNTSTHKGGLVLTILSNGDSAWGGNHNIGINKLNTIIDLSQEYCTMVADMQVTNFGLVIWLRGGSARYWITSNGGQSVTVTPKYEEYTAASNTVAPCTDINTTRLNNFRWNNLWTIKNATNATTATNLSAAPTITAAGTATVTLLENTNYTLTVGGQSIIFKTPAMYTHPTGAGNNHIPSGGSSGQFLKYSSSGVATWSALPTASTSAAGIIQIGSESTNAMAGNTTVTNVLQGTTTTDSWRKVILSGGDVYAAATTAVSNRTSQVYQAVDVAVQPSTGTVAATKYVIGTKVRLEYNSTDLSLDFVFI